MERMAEYGKTGKNLQKWYYFTDMVLYGNTWYAYNSWGNRKPKNCGVIEPLKLAGTF